MALLARVSNWHVPHFNDELAKEVDATHDVDVIYRRVTYDSFAGDRT